MGAQCGRLAFGIGAFPAAPLLVGGTGVEVLLPAHVVDVGFATYRIEEPDPVDHVGQQVHVVADDHQPAGVVAQEIPEPAHRISVEVVGRLVEQQRGRRSGTGVGCGKKNPGQLNSAPLTAGQGAQLLGQHAVGQSETRADPARFAFGAVAAERGEALLELAVAADRTITGGVVSNLGHQRLLLFQVGEQGVQSACREHPVAREHVEVTLFGILRQITDLAGACHGARVRFPLAREDAQRRRLAGAVATDEPDPVPRLYPQRRAVGIEQRARSCADLEVRSRDHGHSPCAELSWGCVATCRR